MEVGEEVKRRLARWDEEQQSRDSNIRGGNRPPKYRLVYYPHTGVGEPIRCTFALGGVPFEDLQVETQAEFQSMRLGAAYWNMPVLLVNGRPLGQALAILRYLGKVVEYEGRPLYPEDP